MNGWRTNFMCVAIGAACTMLSPAVASAQLRAGAIQLPTFNFFTVNTTVEVPDGGGAMLGGTNSAASGRVERGMPGLGFRPFGNVATGSTRGGGTMSVHATIHDFDAMDRQLLGEGFDASAATTPAREAALARLPVMLRPAPDRLVGPSGSRAAPMAVDSTGGTSLADIRRQQSADDAALQQEAAALFQQASDLQAAGKPGVAKIYYQMAARRATGDLKVRALAELRRLSTAAQSVADRGNAAR